MKEDLTRREALLIEMVWLLSYGSSLEQGMQLPEVMRFLDSRLKNRDNKTVLEILDEEGHRFLEELKSKLNAQSD